MSNFKFYVLIAGIRVLRRNIDGMLRRGCSSMIFAIYPSQLMFRKHCEARYAKQGNYLEQIGVSTLHGWVQASKVSDLYLGSLLNGYWGMHQNSRNKPTLMARCFYFDGGPATTYLGNFWVAAEIPQSQQSQTVFPNTCFSRIEELPALNPKP